MGISSVTSMSSMSGVQMTMSGSADPKIKNIQNEITGVQQQMQMLSSKEELSVNEKANERKKLQKEISGLNTELKQRQEAFRKSQKREIMMAELREDQKPTDKDKAENIIPANDAAQNKSDEKKLPADDLSADQQITVIAKNSDGTVILKGKMNQNEKDGIDAGKKQAAETSLSKTEEKDLPDSKRSAAATEKDKETVNTEEETKNENGDTDTGLSRREIHALVSADVSAQQADRQGAVIARIRDGIVILKSEMNQDERRSINTERKQEELEKLEKKEQRATIFQFSVLGGANNAMKSAAKANVSETQNRTQINTENNAFINALKSSKEESQASQQKFYVSFGY